MTVHYLLSSRLGHWNSDLYDKKLYQMGADNLYSMLYRTMHLQLFVFQNIKISQEIGKS